uniref:Uncharacterized protein n=1 Tax=Pediastrum angulosum TaxID=271408 RepID=A0A2U8GHQ8_9CHLO|nr:hypothetical protein [Pediastrum angulosum]AWI68118.1 hypothetical protein [Pediastrum angulosum]
MKLEKIILLEKEILILKKELSNCKKLFLDSKVVESDTVFLEPLKGGPLDSFDSSSVPSLSSAASRTESEEAELKKLRSAFVLDCAVSAPREGEEMKKTSKLRSGKNLSRSLSLPKPVGDKTLISFKDFNYVSYPKNIVISEDCEVLRLENSFLQHFLEESLKGEFLLKYSLISNIIFNMIVLDIETNESQLIFGFYFSSLNCFVQFVIDKDSPSQVHEKYQNILRKFINQIKDYSFSTQENLLKLYSSVCEGEEPSPFSSSFGIFDSKQLQSETKERSFPCSALNREESPFTLSVLTGYNLSNYDLIILEKFLEHNDKNSNLVLQCRSLAIDLLKNKMPKDWAGYSPLMRDFFVIDILWQSGKRLGSWISILNKTNLFPKLKMKHWNNSKYSRVPKDKLNEWLAYNRNDLLVTHCLGLYSNNYLNYFLPRWFDFINNLSNEDLIVLLSTRSLF